MKNLVTKALLCVALLAATLTGGSAIAGDGVFNQAKGIGNALVDNVANNTPANSGIVVILLQAGEADAALQDYDNASLLLAAAGNTEATFTNYARKVLTDAEIVASVVDDTNNRRTSDMPDQVWTSAGGATNNTLARMLTFYDPDVTGGTDADLVPLTFADFVATTNGNNLTAIISATGFFVAN